jgi:hypothetical protein
MEKMMTKKYKNEGYIKTKIGTENYDPTISLMEKIWPNKKSYTGADVNKLYQGLIENADVKKLNQTVVELPIKSQIKSRMAEAKASLEAVKQLNKELGKKTKSISLTV